jgi:putative copper export protein
MSAAFSALTGWILFGGLTLSVGALVSRWLMLPRAFASGNPSILQRRNETARLGTAGALLVVVGLALYFARQLQEFRDPFVPWREDAELLLMGTAWGTTWLRAAVASLVAVGAFLVAGKGRSWGWWLATPVVLALGAFPGLTGHAAAAEELRTIALLADAAHVWAAGAWLGGLAVVLHLERIARGEGDPRVSLLPALVPAFSPIAMVSVGALIVTGAFASWSHLSGFGALLSTGYGRTLLFKLALVAVVLGLGARNFHVLTPRLGSTGGDDAMRRSATTELIVAELVLIATAVLVRLSPMDH